MSNPLGESQGQDVHHMGELRGNTSAIDRFRSDLQRTTGFMTYLEYLKTLHIANGTSVQDEEEHDCGLQGLKQALQQRQGVDATDNSCVIFDVQRTNGSASQVGMHLHIDMTGLPDPSYSLPYGRGNLLDESLTVSEALESPLEEGSIRVVVWYMAYMTPFPGWIDALGLKVQIPPSFFEQLLRTKNTAESRRASPQQFIIGNAVAIECTYQPRAASPNATIMIIAFTNPPCKRSSAKQYLDKQMRRFPPFGKPNRGDGMYKVNRSLGLMQYVQLFNQYLSLHNVADLNPTQMLYTSLLPLFTLNILDLEDYHCHAWSLLRALESGVSLKQKDEGHQYDLYSKLDQSRTQLRVAIEDSEDGHRHFLRHVLSKPAKDWFHTQVHRNNEIEWEAGVLYARRLEAEIRDYMQLVAGRFSIDESRKAIELSNVQIQEGKQGLLVIQ